MRKRAALAVTSGASLEAALPEQFVGARRRLERLARALKDGLALREAGAPGWRGVLMARADAARTIAGAAAGAGRVRAAADALRAGSAAALSASERAERSASDRTLSEAAGVRVFQTEVSAVLGSCVEVDAALCEFRRYRAKVDRLAESARTKEEKLEANRRKLDVAAAKFAARINCAQAMADSTLEKRDRYLGALLRAFWRAEQTFEEPMREHFREFREAVTRCPAEGVARAPDPDEEDWTTD